MRGASRVRWAAAVAGLLMSGSALAACSASPDPVALTSSATGVASSASQGVPTKADQAAEEDHTTSEPDAQAAATVSPDGVAEGYLDMGYGIALPIDGIPGCDAPAELFIGSIGTEVITEILRPENLVDHGPREHARGEVAYDDQGRISTYTVASGDVSGSIAGRLCLYGGGGMIERLNGYSPDEAIHPGDVLVIDPATIPGFEYEDPYL